MVGCNCVVRFVSPLFSSDHGKEVIAFSGGNLGAINKALFRCAHLPVIGDPAIGEQPSGFEIIE
jgi:hypothetical protein